jgi:hypothetical protein
MLVHTKEETVAGVAARDERPLGYRYFSAHTRRFPITLLRGHVDNGKTG